MKPKTIKSVDDISRMLKKKAKHDGISNYRLAAILYEDMGISGMGANRKIRGAMRSGSMSTDLLLLLCKELEIEIIIR